jgi:hypothetical protein
MIAFVMKAGATPRAPVTTIERRTTPTCDR